MKQPQVNKNQDYPRPHGKQRLWNASDSDEKKWEQLGEGGKD